MVIGRGGEAGDLALSLVEGACRTSIARVNLEYVREVRHYQDSVTQGNVS